MAILPGRRACIRRASWWREKWAIRAPRRALTHLAELADVRGDLERACPLYEEALTLDRDMGNNAWLLIVLVEASLAERRRGQRTRAATLLAEADRTAEIEPLRPSADAVREGSDRT